MEFHKVLGTPNRGLPLLGLEAELRLLGSLNRFNELGTTLQEGKHVSSTGLKLQNKLLLLESQANVIQAVQQAVLSERLHVKVLHQDLASLGVENLLVGKSIVSCLPAVATGYNFGQNHLLRKADGQQTVLERVVVENVTK